MTDWHEYPTNYSGGNNVDGVAEFFGSYPATIVPMAGTGMLVIVWLVSFALSYMVGAMKAFTVASFVSTILGTYLWRIGMVQVEWVFVLAVMTIIGFLLSWGENSG